ncbi:hypothetical protein Vqi01_42450 [Micromonospora qiuiae]|uniref:Uncharacterized protein n=1 Tax=Micromonospora qiuiae TaxID=502268 RepID=A0ABQ4JFH9_9ACTN|nr:hypothetical protein [Micromonospora qiuiae]GIJ29083.1 hypothetical protein Vqi01_42450 [Micromonospora qiuiae]
MAITPSRQRNAVSEGMALGLIMCDRFTLSWDKVAIDLSFEGAWRSWEYRHRFSQVDTDIRHGSDGVRVMTRADEGKHTFNFYWDTSGREIAIYPRNVWSDGKVDVDQAAEWIDGGVPAKGWRELATDFLRRLEK